MQSIDELFSNALQLHTSGELRRCASVCEQIIAASPRRADAWHLLGVSAYQLGDAATAAGYISKAIDIDGQQATFFNSLGLTQRAMHNLTEARSSFERALRLSPELEAAHHNLGLVFESTGDLPSALRHFQEAVRLRPDHAEAHNGVGNVCRAQGRLFDAVAAYQAALRLRPDLAEALNNLGATLVQLRRVDEGLALLRRSLQLRPEAAETRANLAIALKSKGRLAQSAAHFAESLRLQRDFVDARIALGILLQECGQLDDAAACYKEVLRLRSKGPEPRHALGQIYQQQGLENEAEACYRRVIADHPDYTNAHYHLGMLRLSQGRFAEGWEECQWRWRTKESPREFSQPEWDGSPLGGRTILLHPEQGMGDTLQFVRYIPMLEEMGARVVVEVHPPLLPIVRNSFAAEVIALGSRLPAFDVHLPLLSLPRVLRTRVETIPANVPYLKVDPELVEFWRRRLSQIAGFRVGIGWQGNPDYMYDASRSIPLVEFAPLATIGGIALVSLQQKDGLTQLPLVRGQFTIHDLGGDVDRDRGAFVDTAAIMKNMDLIVTSDTALAHLAGALGVPVWTAVSRVADWRWMQSRSDNPWYPTMRIFRQQRWREWSSVFAVIADELSREVSRAKSQGSA